MKQPKAPTLAQKKLIASAGLKWKNWSVVHENNVSMAIINKRSGCRRVLMK